MKQGEKERTFSATMIFSTRVTSWLRQLFEIPAWMVNQGSFSNNFEI